MLRCDKKVQKMDVENIFKKNVDVNEENPGAAYHRSSTPKYNSVWGGNCTKETSMNLCICRFNAK